MGLVSVLVIALAAVNVAKTPEAPSDWLASLPATLSQETEVAAIEVHGCRVSIGTAVDESGLPPLHHAWVRKEGCETGGYVLLGTSYSVPSVLVAGRKQGLVASFTFRSTPSGSAYQFANVLSLDFVTGAVTHRSTLGALPAFGTGIVQPSSLELAGDGSVVVRGTKNGVMPGEVGSGDQFVAVFARFLKDPEFSPAPSGVTAF